MPNGKASTIEAARWLTLNETLEHIRGVLNCMPIEAQRYLKAKIADRIIPAKWADSEGANDIPNPRHLQGTKLNLSETGLAYYKRTDAYRPLLVLRSAVVAAWQPGKNNLNPSKEVEGAKHGAPSNKHEHQQMDWVTLVDAEEHIEVVQNCDSVEALRQLKEEIGDGIVAVKWADDLTAKPNVTILKTSEFILFGPGLAPDGKQLRELLVNRVHVLRYWPAPDDCNMLRPVSVRRAHSIPQVPKHQKTATKLRSKPHGKASEVSIREALRRIYSESHSKPPNIEEAWLLIKNILPNASRGPVRAVLGEPEFDKQRQKAGNQSREAAFCHVR
jgi:hypothetical protein